MDSKNVILAVVLSTLVLIIWATFFEAPVIEQQTSEKQITENQNLSSPSIDENEKDLKNEAARDDVINKTNRIKIENENIKGSISLKGAIIDDIIFKNYRETLNKKLSSNSIFFVKIRPSPLFHSNVTGLFGVSVALPLFFQTVSSKGNFIF